MAEAEKDSKAPAQREDGKTPGPVLTGGYKALSPSGRNLERWREKAKEAK